MARPVIILGSPGTGKTAACLAEVERALAAGVSSHRIAYVSFTRRAVMEAKERAAQQFDLDPDEDLPWFRTLHSLALHALGAGSDELLGKENFKELGDLLGEDIRGFDALDESGEPRAQRPAALALFLDQLARVTERPLRDVYEDLPLEDRPPWPLVERAARTYAYYRSDTGLMDFTDLLEHALQEGLALDLDLAVVDEAQDLSSLQWDLVTRLLGGSRRLVVAGDDDQAIYRWAGADVGRFVNLVGDEQHLPRSHRLPRSVYDLAGRLASRLSQRRVKRSAPADAEGEVRVHRDLAGVPFDDDDWLVLARHGQQVNHVAKTLRQLGLPYETRNGSSVSPSHLLAIRGWVGWQRGNPVPFEQAVQAVKWLPGAGQPTGDEVTADSVNVTDVHAPWWEALNLPTATMEYYRALKRRGFNLDDRPKIRLSTIHGAKGAQAKKVALLTRLNQRTDWALRSRPDDEHRVFYVGVTRAQEQLHLVDEFLRFGYPLGGLL